MRLFLLSFLLAGITSAGPNYVCGKRQKVKRPYGLVELRVRCDYRSENRISVLEYKGNIQHGFQMGYDTLWRKLDSTFFKNGKAEGTRLFWDTLGNVIGRENFRKGVNVGKREFYFAPGRPSLIKSYNGDGKEDGAWNEWWPNGNKKAEFEAKNGDIIAGSEFYQDGKPRVRYRSEYDSINKSAIDIKLIEGEAWSPIGKPAGRIENGNGEWVLFPDGHDSTSLQVIREVYKDSLLVKMEKLSPSDLVKWTQ